MSRAMRSRVAAVASLGLVFLVFLMKRSVAETAPNKK